MFNFEDFDIKLNTEVVGRNFTYSEEIDSTNSFLIKDKNSKNGSLCLAEFQKKGKGRKDREWHSAKNLNLTFSILLNKRELLDNINYVNFATSLVVANTIENLYQIRTELKWPNDVLINGKKISGILLESSSSGSKIDKLVVGMGINVNQQTFATDFLIEPTSLRLETGNNVEREIFLAELLNNFEETIFKIPNNNQHIIREWKNKCRMIGEKISIVDDNGSKHGMFYDIDDEGYLLLRNGDDIERIHYGDVSLR